MSKEVVEVTGQQRAYMKALGVDANQLFQLCFKSWTLDHTLADSQLVRRASGGNLNITIGDIGSHNSVVLRLLNDLRLSIAPSSTWIDVANVLVIGAAIGGVVAGTGVWLVAAF